MTNSVIAEGKTTAEAVEKGLKELNVSKDMVNIKVLEEDKKRSFYSILAPRVVKVELTIKENAEKKEHKEKQEKPKEKRATNENLEEIEVAKTDIEKFLQELLKDDYKYEVRIEKFDILVNIDGENINHLIGYRGETINALQTIISSVANKKSSSKIKVFVDIAGYKERRIKTLEELAEKISKTVIRTGKAITLEPMTAYERKIIHTKLQENNKVKTFSKGEEPHRRIVVTLNK
mgnify:CR=1 FL=1